MQRTVLTVALVAGLVWVTARSARAARARAEGFRSTDDDALDRVVFWGRQDTATALQADADGFTYLLTPMDLQARRTPTRHDYRRRAAAAAADFTDAQKDALRTAVVRADGFFRSPTFCGLDAPIVATDLVALPWVFAITRGDAYEDGLPHTRGMTVYLSTQTDFTEPALTRLLIHERIHIYQRNYPDRLTRGLHARGWRVAEPPPSADVLARRRANPDRPERVLERNGRVYLALYKPDPTRITDADATYEDPYEEMAYRIAAAYRPPPPRGINVRFL